MFLKTFVTGRSACNDMQTCPSDGGNVSLVGFDVGDGLVASSRPDRRPLGAVDRERGVITSKPPMPEVTCFDRLSGILFLFVLSHSGCVSSTVHFKATDTTTQE